MTREIKFRAWAFASKKMFMLDDAFEFTDGELREVPNTVVMQFTGLTDRNGKEIYEGDIVKASTENTNHIWEVYWDKNDCAFRLEKGVDVIFMRQINHQLFEVIGNIYENPELLKTN